MDNVTEINIDINDNATVLNSQLNDESHATILNNDVLVGNSFSDATVLNAEINAVSSTDNEISNDSIIKSADSSSILTKGTVICDKYVVVEKLGKETGEANLYICEYAQRQYIAKVYRRNVSIKKAISEKLKNITSPFVANVFATGEINGFPVEIQPYYKNGSLEGSTLSFDEIRKKIVPSLNEGLKTLHDNGIIHKDLKPANIMHTDNMQSVAIIDFGISSIMEDGDTVIVTKTGFTPVYSAPETFKNVFLPDSDYYSLGVTLLELFTGKVPYAGLSQEEIARYISVQKLPLPESMPKELKKLIMALTYPDITNRNDKQNPNRRWGYNEVIKWLKGERQVLPGQGRGNNEAKPFRFLNKDYTERKDLVEAMAAEWKQGKKVLFRGTLSDYYSLIDEEAEEICLKAEEDATRLSGQDDFIFWRTLYELDNSCQKLFWKGRTFNTLADLGRSLLEALYSKDSSLLNLVNDMLNNHILSRYLEIIGETEESRKAVLDAFEKQYIDATEDPHMRGVALYSLGYVLSGQRLLKLGKESFRTIGELTDYMKKLQSVSFETLQPFCHLLVERENVLAPQFEAWLYVLGKKQEVDEWRGNFYDYYDFEEGE